MADGALVLMSVFRQSYLPLIIGRKIASAVRYERSDMCSANQEDECNNQYFGGMPGD